MKKYLIVCGLMGLTFSFGVIILNSLKYFGPNAVSPSHPCYVPGEDWPAAILLSLGLGLAGIYALIDTFKFFVKIDKNGVTVRGIITGTRFCSWEDICEIKAHDFLSMYSIRARNKEGEKQTLWVTFYISNLSLLIEKLNDHNLFFEVQKEYINEAKLYLSSQGYTSAIPFKLYIRELCIWHVFDEPDEYIVLLHSETEDELLHFEHFKFSGHFMSLLVEIKNKLAQKAFSFDHEYQEILLDFVIDIITEYKKEENNSLEKPSLSIQAVN